MIEIQLDPLYGINRKAVYECLIYNQRAKTVTTQWVVYFIDANGDEITGPLFNRYSKEFIADTSVMVNPATGDYVQLVNVGTEEEPNMQYPEGSITEYDFFVFVAGNVPVIVHEMIMGTGLKAKAAGRFDL